MDEVAGSLPDPTGDPGGSSLELVAGEVREVLLALAVGDRDGLADPDRFVAYLPLGALDPAWLDALTLAVHHHRGIGPTSFRAALRPLAGDLVRSLEEEVGLVDPVWLEAFADLDEAACEPLARTWLATVVGHPEAIDVALAAELVGTIVRFARRARAARATLWAATPPILAIPPRPRPDQPSRTAVPEAVTMSIEPPTVS